MGKMGPGKVFTMKRCSLIRGVHYERFHCIMLCVLPKLRLSPGHVGPGIKISRVIVAQTKFV